MPVDEMERVDDAGGSSRQAASAWARMVERIQAREPQALEELYAVFCKGIRYYLCRHLAAQDLDDRMHDSYLIVVQAIQAGVIRDPDRLMGFVKTVVRRQVAAHIEDAVQQRKGSADFELGHQLIDQQDTPEAAAIEAQRSEIMNRILNESQDRDREILTRFYLYHQDQEQICSEMGLTETQFRLLKSRAKSRVTELGRKQTTRTALQTLSVRKKAAGSH